MPPASRARSAPSESPGCRDGQPDQQENRAGREVEQDVRPGESSGCRAEAGGQSASITKPATKKPDGREERDARPEGDTLAQEVALARGVERGQGLARLGAAALEPLDDSAGAGYLPLRSWAVSSQSIRISTRWPSFRGVGSSNATLTSRTRVSSGLPGSWGLSRRPTTASGISSTRPFQAFPS